MEEWHNIKQEEGIKIDLFGEEIKTSLCESTFYSYSHDLTEEKL